jgi:tRNA(adenine34) deaminase
MAKLDNHTEFMNLALAEAKKAGQIDEVPIGAVLVSENGKILAAAHNQTRKRNDPTAHAEIITLRRAAEKMNNYRLLNTSLYVTVEPCIMCTGALIHARVERIVYGASDLKWGGVDSLYKIADDSRLNHQIEILSGVCEEDCRNLMQDFFHAKRIKHKW